LVELVLSNLLKSIQVPSKLLMSEIRPAKFSPHVSETLLLLVMAKSQQSVFQREKVLDSTSSKKEMPDVVKK